MGHESSSALNYNNMPNTNPEHEVKLEVVLHTAMEDYLKEVSRVDQNKKPAEKKLFYKNVATENFKNIGESTEFSNLGPGERFMIVFEAAKKLVEANLITTENIGAIDAMTENLGINLVYNLKNYIETTKSNREAKSLPESIDTGRIEKPSLVENIQTKISLARNVMRINDLTEPELEENELEKMAGEKIKKLEIAASKNNIAALKQLATILNTCGVSTTSEVKANQEKYGADEIKELRAKLATLHELYKLAIDKLKENEIAVATEKSTY